MSLKLDILSWYVG